MNYIIIFIIVVVCIIITLFSMKKGKNNSQIDNYDYDPNEESPENLQTFLGDIQTKKEDSEMTDEEKYQEALNTINHPAGIIPGLGNPNPIDAPSEEIELDSKEIPWELQDNNKQ